MIVGLFKFSISLIIASLHFFWGVSKSDDFIKNIFCNHSFLSDRLIRGEGISAIRGFIETGNFILSERGLEVSFALANGLDIKLKELIFSNFNNSFEHSSAWAFPKSLNPGSEDFSQVEAASPCLITVSYTHLTLPTILLV